MSADHSYSREFCFACNEPKCRLMFEGKRIEVSGDPANTLGIDDDAPIFAIEDLPADLAASNEAPADAPKITYLTARPYTRKMKKALATWPGKTYIRPCCECGKSAVIAESSKIALDAALESGEDLRVVCDNCADQVNATEPTMVTEEQVTEAAIVAERQSKKDRN